MIFVTIGTQEPFDRLLNAIDEIAPKLDDCKIIAQAFSADHKSKNIETIGFIPPVEFNRLFESATLIVSHAGMGTIISALEKKKPILVLPRRKEFGEHRSDHQFATARKFDELKYIHVAYSEDELKAKLVELMNSELKHLHSLSSFASQQLIDSLQDEIKGEKEPTSKPGRINVVRKYLLKRKFSQ
jgi:UDP-N-acetylglucosamine transferase subunit ALG13